MERKLVKGFYEEENKTQSEDELIREVCKKNKYEVVTKSQKDVVLFKDSRGELVAICKENLHKYTVSAEQRQVDEFYSTWMKTLQNFSAGC